MSVNRTALVAGSIRLTSGISFLIDPVRATVVAFHGVSRCPDRRPARGCRAARAGYPGMVPGIRRRGGRHMCRNLGSDASPGRHRATITGIRVAVTTAVLTPACQPLAEGLLATRLQHRPVHAGEPSTPGTTGAIDG